MAKELNRIGLINRLCEEAGVRRRDPTKSYLAKREVLQLLSYLSTVKRGGNEKQVSKAGRV